MSEPPCSGLAALTAVTRCYRTLSDLRVKLRRTLHVKDCTFDFQPSEWSRGNAANQHGFGMDLDFYVDCWLDNGQPLSWHMLVNWDPDQCLWLIEADVAHDPTGTGSSSLVKLPDMTASTEAELERAMVSTAQRLAETVETLDLLAVSEHLGPLGWDPPQLWPSGWDPARPWPTTYKFWDSSTNPFL